MKLWIAAALLCLVQAAPVWSASRTTLYLDGAIIEEEVTVHAGRAAVRLPAAMQPGSLRVRPSAAAVIDRVEISPAPPIRNREGEATLLARKDRLADRLKALETREEIFRAAARSQSGKSPRKTKTNPDPLLAIRQGTNLALAQLEEVYRSQRKARQELNDVETLLANLDKQPGAPGSVARISFAGKGKGATVSYIRTDLAWIPRYDFRFTDASRLEVTVRPKLPPGTSRPAAAVVFARLADGVPENLLPNMLMPRQPIVLPVERALYRGGPGSSLTFTVSNTGGFTLPPGEATCYWRGEYLGVVAFPGCGPGEARDVTVGTLPSPAEQASP